MFLKKAREKSALSMVLRNILHFFLEYSEIELRIHCIFHSANLFFSFEKASLFLTVFLNVIYYYVCFEYLNLYCFILKLYNLKLI